MKRYILSITAIALYAFSAAIASAPAFSYDGPVIIKAIEEGNTAVIQMMLDTKPDLPAREKRYLVRKAKEVARQKKRDIVLLKITWDPRDLFSWDFIKCAVGAGLLYTFAPDPDFFGDSQEYGENQKLYEKRFNIAKSFNDAAKKTKSKRVKTELLKLGEKNSKLATKRQELLQKKLDGHISDWAINTAGKVIGAYLLASGYFLTTAKAAYLNAQRIVRKLENMPITEDDPDYVNPKVTKK